MRLIKFGFQRLLPLALIAGHTQLSLGRPTTVHFADAISELEIKTARPWEAPNYANQKTALGFTTEASPFAVPNEMQERVDFWRRVYTEVSTDQGYLHDSQYVPIVYETIDFRPIQIRTDLTAAQKIREREKLVDERKKVIVASLVKLHSNDQSTELDRSTLLIRDMFQNINEKNKYQNAAERGRLRFQLGQNDRFYRGIYISGEYIREMEQIFSEEGLPKELTRLPFVESSFNTLARSRVGASGIWQFMPATGRQYMKVNRWLDERNDPITATRAAARKLRYNYQKLGSWPLAVTAYNFGPAGLSRLLKKTNSTALTELIDLREGRFGFASASFYASFLAALHVEAHADQYFKNPVWAITDDTQIVKLRYSLSSKDLINLFDQNISEARHHNPHLSSSFWRSDFSLPSGTWVRIFKSKDQAFKDTFAKNQRVIPLDAEFYTVQSGDTLSTIAASMGTSTRALIDVNQLDNPHQIHVGQKLRIPSKSN